MSLSKAKAYLAQFGKADDILEFEVSSATVERAAQAIGCESARIAKTLSFAVGDRTVLVVCPGDARVSNPKFKATFAAKPKMLPADDVEARTGHAIGGVCPFGVHEDCEIYLDESLKRFDVVYPACGSSNSAIALTIDELERMVDGGVDRGTGAMSTSNTAWVDVCKLSESEEIPA